MEHGSARELLRASATDADAVRQYLQSIDGVELNGLLDGIAPRDAKCASKGKKKSEFLVEDDWLPLVHLLVRCETTRLRAASRIIQVLRRGSPSELESMQLLTEINLGYAAALDGLQDLRTLPKAQHAVRRRELLEELKLVLEIVFSFLGEVVHEKKPGKVLPQLLGLVPYFLGMVGELSGSGEDEETRVASENLAKLLELPWSCQTVPSLLDVLVDDTTLMSRESWQQLQENVERMVTTSPEMASETMNPVIRECVMVASVTGDHRWIGIVRYLLRQLPVHLRQEAEFNLQMSFHQSPRIVSLVCESIRSSKLTEDANVDIKDASSLFDDSEFGGLDLTLDWRDVFLLLHSLQASKPILHHRTSSSRVATEASVFTDIEQLAWRIMESDIMASNTTTSLMDANSRAPNNTIEKRVLDQVELLLNFGGKQIHAREWKALLLMDIAFFWTEQRHTSDEDGKLPTSKCTVALLLLQSVFETAPETRSELLSSLFERSQKPAQRKIAGETLSQLFISQSGKLFPHLNAIQDWLSMQFQRSFDSAREFFLIASRLAAVYKDLYNFLMVFLHHELPFNEQQEEEIVSALKNSITACHDIQAWSFGRLEQLFKFGGTQLEKHVISLRKNSWEELQRFLSQEVGKFIQPTISSMVGYGNDGDSENEYEEEDSVLPRFRFSSLDAFYQQNASLDGAASIGFVFQKLLSCLIGFQTAATRAKVSSEGLPIEALSEKDSDIKQWLVDLVPNWKYFFHWICQDSDDLLNQSVPSKAYEKSAWWKLVARIYIGCAICNVAIEMLTWRQPVQDSGDQDMGYRGLVAFRADDRGVSVWSLMEVQFSLHRMVRKLATHYASEMDTSLSKEYLRAASYGLRRVLQPERLRILTAIKSALQEADDSRTSHNERPSGMSFDAALFALDSCYYSALGDEELHGAFFPRDIEVGALNEAGPILEMLLCIYLSVRNRIVAVSDSSSSDDARRSEYLPRATDDKSDEPAPRFSVYADSISTKFPTSARHLVAPGKNAKTVVLLDTKAGEEMLEHVCAAIGRVMEAMLKTSNLRSVHEQLGLVLQRISWTGQHREPEGQRNANGNNFVLVSRYFLSDVKECAQQDGLAKLAVSCASLSKCFRNIGAGMEDWNVDCAEWHTLSSLAYDILCDNVVYKPRLLRLLLNISLPPDLALHIKTFVTMKSKIEGIIQACGLNSAITSTISSKGRPKYGPSLIKNKEKHGTPSRQKRLRQGFDARSRYGLRVDSDSDASYSSDSDVSASSDHPNAVVEANADSGSSYTPNRDRIPHLQSEACQSIAILAVLVVLDQSMSSLLSAITTKNSGSGPCTFSHHQEIMGYIRIHELANRAICNNRDISWWTRNVLLKMLNMVELGLRIGKASGSLRKAFDADGGLTHEVTISIFEASVLSALRSRTWVDGIKDASRDTGTKTKVSATLLKMDIFFLQVPGTVQAWLKETTLPEATTNRLKALVSQVKEKIAPTDQTNAHRGKARARQRLLGVVPIVRKRRKRLRSRHPIIDAFLNEEDGVDAFADLEDFIE
ncbi:hypothetical protein PRIC2_003360 [Phytophthora ramorum]